MRKQLGNQAVTVALKKKKKILSILVTEAFWTKKRPLFACKHSFSFQALRRSLRGMQTQKINMCEKWPVEQQESAEHSPTELLLPTHTRGAPVGGRAQVSGVLPFRHQQLNPDSSWVHVCVCMCVCKKMLPCQISFEGYTAHSTCEKNRCYA